MTDPKKFSITSCYPTVTQDNGYTINRYTALELIRPHGVTVRITPYEFFIIHHEYGVAERFAITDDTAFNLIDLSGLTLIGIEIIASDNLPINPIDEVAEFEPSVEGADEFHQLYYGCQLDELSEVINHDSGNYGCVYKVHALTTLRLHNDQYENTLRFTEAIDVNFEIITPLSGEKPHHYDYHRFKVLNYNRFRVAKK